MLRSLSILLAAALAACPIAVGAQGTLSAQGFGYPPGQLSTRARATAGAFGEFDPQSPINPAALSNWGRPALFFQYDPEFRRSFAGAEEDRARTSRFPVIAAALPIKQTLMFGIAASTLLDRTWGTRSTRRELLGADSVTFIESSRSVGAINDARLGVGWSRSKSLRLGAGLHLITGENTLRVRREFASTAFDTLDQTARLGYGGIAGSVGVETRLTQEIWLAGSYRLGGRMRAYSGDTTVAKARVPSRLGAALRYEGIRGLALAASANWTEWTSMRALGSERLSVSDALDFGIGVEGRGPRWFESDIPLRAGYRRRTLPFTVAGKDKVTESDLSVGFGIPLVRSRSSLDFGIERAWRQGIRAADVRVLQGASQQDIRGANERAWTLSFGILVRQ